MSNHYFFRAREMNIADPDDEWKKDETKKYVRK